MFLPHPRHKPNYIRYAQQRAKLSRNLLQPLSISVAVPTPLPLEQEAAETSLPISRGDTSKIDMISRSNTHIRVSVNPTHEEAVTSARRRPIRRSSSHSVLNISQTRSSLHDHFSNGSHTKNSAISSVRRLKSARRRSKYLSQSKSGASTHRSGRVHGSRRPQISHQSKTKVKRPKHPKPGKLPRSVPLTIQTASLAGPATPETKGPVSSPINVMSSNIRVKFLTKQSSHSIRREHQLSPSFALPSGPLYHTETSGDRTLTRVASSPLPKKRPAKITISPDTSTSVSMNNTPTSRVVGSGLTMFGSSPQIRTLSLSLPNAGKAAKRIKPRSPTYVSHSTFLEKQMVRRSPKTVTPQSSVLPDIGVISRSFEDYQPPGKK